MLVAACLFLGSLLAPAAMSQQGQVCDPGTTPGTTPVALEAHPVLAVNHCQAYTIKGLLDGEVSPTVQLDLTHGRGFHFQGPGNPTSVQANDFTFTLCADVDACGSVTIEVPLSNGSIRMGSIRTTSGYWVLVDHECPIPGKPMNSPENFDGRYTREEGGDRVEVDFAEKCAALAWGQPPCPDPASIFPPNCGNPSCNSQLSEEGPCIENDWLTKAGWGGGWPSWFINRSTLEYCDMAMKELCVVRINHWVFKCD